MPPRATPAKRQAKRRSGAQKARISAMSLLRRPVSLFEARHAAIEHWHARLHNIVGKRLSLYSVAPLPLTAPTQDKPALGVNLGRHTNFAKTVPLA